MLLEKQETNINYGAGTDEAIIYTAYPRDIKRLKKLMHENPEDVRMIRDDKDGITISVPKNYIKIGRPRKTNYSDEYKEQLRERMTNIRKSQLEKSQNNRTPSGIYGLN